MNAKKCDRCGAFYTIRCASGIESAMKTLADAIAGEDRDPVSKLDASVDLCRKCEEEFCNWWEEGNA